MHTIEFTDIRIRAALPLHPYLSEHPHLFLRLVADGSVCGDTAGVDGDLASGIWEFNGRLYAHRAKQSLNVAVLTGAKGPGIQAVSVTIQVAELLEQEEACPNRHQYIVIFDSPAAIQLKLVITCSIKLTSDRVPQAVGDKDDPGDWRVRNIESEFERHRADPFSREALETFYELVTSIPGGNESEAHALSDLGYGYHRLYDNEHGKADLAKAVSIHEESMRFTGPLHPRLAMHTHRFAMALFEQFQQSGGHIDIERAISYFQTALRFTEDLDAAKPSRFSNLGNALHLRFQRFGGLVDLENSILCQREAIGGIPHGHPDKPSMFDNLGIALGSRFELLDGLTDLEEAISNHRQAAKLMPDGHPVKPGNFHNLALALRSRFERLGSLTDLEDAISNLRHAVQLTPDDHPNKPTQFSCLGDALRSRFACLGGLTDLEEAISNLRDAVQLTPDNHPNKPSQFSALGYALQSRFERLGGITDLQDAISHLRKAVQLTPSGHRDKPSGFNHLGRALQSRFERLGDPADLEDALSNLRHAVQLEPDSHPGQLNNLGRSLRSRFESLGDLADLEESISNFRHALQLTPDGHTNKPSGFNNLGLALRSRFERLGGIPDLEDAISNLRQAAQLTPGGHSDKPALLNNLGFALQSRFERLGGLTDLEEAISNLRHTVQLTPDDHLNNLCQFGGLGHMLISRFERLGGLADLEDSISNFRHALQLTPGGHLDKPRGLINLGCALQCRYEALGSLADLEDAISIFQQAVQLMPNGHPDNPSGFNNLGIALRLRFECLDDLGDLEDGISNLHQAVRLSPDGHPDKPARLYNLGVTFLHRFRRLDTINDLDSGLTALSNAANFTTGSAMVRFKAVRSWAEYAERHSRSPLDAFSCAIDLLPRIAWLGLTVSDQHALLANMGGVVRDAVAAAIRYREYETAVVWAEQGRSIVWQNLLRLRSPIDDLRETHPELARRLHSIARQLEHPGSHPEMKASAGDASHTHLSLAVEWDHLIDEIRRIPHFEGFMGAKSFRQLAAAAHEGPVVILNVNDSQCDALVLSSDDTAEIHVSVLHIPLERFSYETSKKLFHGLTDLLSSARVRERSDRKTGRAQSQADGESKFKSILRILWQDVVKPVIEGLAFPTESKRPPRIWWCATGFLAFLPIHAAGRYDTSEIGEKVSDYVVSSYTPTLNAILKPSDPMVQDGFQVLMVAQASAPGADPIPKTEDEVRIIQALTTGSRRVILMGKDATVERVQKEMIQSNWIHLACHGKQNSDNPMESGFLLHDRMLKLSEIVKMSLPKADFAFLSACQTAMGDEKVAEESVHLAAGMILSGCRGVIATTWSIRDEDGPRIAEDVYSRIFRDGKPKRKEAAYALHEAVMRLRDSGAKCTSWVPFIHIGR